MEQVSSSPPPFASHYYSINAPYSSTKLFVLLLNSSIGFIDATADGKKEGARRQGSRCMQLLDGLKEKRNYWNLKAETLVRTVWRTRFEGDNGPVAKRDCKIN
jgi:hypothetical protein